MNTNRRIALASLAVLAIAISTYFFTGRNDFQKPSNSSFRHISNADDVPASNGSTAGPNTVDKENVIPARYRFSGGSNIPKAENDQSLMAAYSPQEQVIIRSFYASFGSTGLRGANVFDNAFSFKNQRQLSWLAKNGYPMPDEILIASRTSTEELLSLAQTGNFKAKAILLIREYQRPLPLRAAPDSENMKDQTQLTTFQQELLTDGSPFGGYVWAAKSLDMPVSDGRAGVLAGYAFAETMGDDRAALFASEFARSNPGLNPAEALSSYRAMLGIASRNPQLANIPGLMRRPRFEMY